MKVALVRKSYHNSGGVERYVYELSRGLESRGHEVHVFTAEDYVRTGNGIKIHKVPMLKGASFVKVLSFAVFSYLEIKKEKFDVVHSFDRTFYQDVYRIGDGCHKAWLKVSTVGKSSLRRNLLSYLNPLHFVVLLIEGNMFLKKRFKKIIAISFRSKSDVIENYGLKEEDFKVIYNGVDLEEFSPENRNIYRNDDRKMLGLKEDDFVILFVGSGYRRKGLEYLVKAVSIIKEKSDKNIKVLVVGKDKKRFYLELIRSLGLEEEFIFYGRGKGDQMKRLYSLSDVFIMPSLYDPFGYSCLEALSSGLPIIVSRISGASEIVDDSINGLVVNDPTDAVEIAEKIGKLFDDEYRLNLCRSARKLAESYSMKRNIEEVEKVYEEVKEK